MVATKKRVTKAEPAPDFDAVPQFKALREAYAAYVKARDARLEACRKLDNVPPRTHEHTAALFKYHARLGAELVATNAKWQAEMAAVAVIVEGKDMKTLTDDEFHDLSEKLEGLPGELLAPIAQKYVPGIVINDPSTLTQRTYGKQILVKMLIREYLVRG